VRTTLSENGEVTIPQEVRAQLRLRPGDHFVVLSSETPETSYYGLSDTLKTRIGWTLGVRSKDSMCRNVLPGRNRFAILNCERGHGTIKSGRATIPAQPASSAAKGSSPKAQLRSTPSSGITPIFRGRIGRRQMRRQSVLDASIFGRTWMYGRTSVVADVSKQAARQMYRDNWDVAVTCGKRTIGAGNSTATIWTIQSIRLPQNTIANIWNARRLKERSSIASKRNASNGSRSVLSTCNLPTMLLMVDYTYHAPSLWDWIVLVLLEAQCIAFWLLITFWLPISDWLARRRQRKTLEWRYRQRESADRAAHTRGFASFWTGPSSSATNIFVKKILSVSIILLALFSIHSICKAATISGSVKEIHSGAGRAGAAEQVTVTLYRGVLGSSDFQKVETFRTGIDGLYHFENIPKGEYTIHVQDPNVKEPNWGPGAYRRVSVGDDNAVIELDPTVIDYK
jgi:AbrB family looped-hinge helix DNA binding protein